jgi:uncharacterized protein YecE (DUF72 family)
VTRCQAALQLGTATTFSQLGDSSLRHRLTWNSPLAYAGRHAAVLFLLARQLWESGVQSYRTGPVAERVEGSAGVRVGLAGWSNPPAEREERRVGQSHLAYYSEHFSSVEINSSFYRPHQGITYARWRDETPAVFRFSVKMPRSITHESQLRRCADEVARFYDDMVHLRPKLDAVLVQLPPSLEYKARTVRAFFEKAVPPRGIRVVCEPRHASWFTNSADTVLRDLAVSRVAADPARCATADVPGGAAEFAYFRWHGAPQLYYSKYSEARLIAFADTVIGANARMSWCIFDNTARHAAWDDALRFLALLKGRAAAASA